MLHCRNAEIAGVRVKTHDRIVQSLHIALMGLKEIESSWRPATVQQAWQELPLPPEIRKLQPDGLVVWKHGSSEAGLYCGGGEDHGPWAPF